MQRSVGLSLYMAAVGQDVAAEIAVGYDRHRTASLWVWVMDAANGAVGAQREEREALIRRVINPDGSLNLSCTVERHLHGQRRYIPVLAILEALRWGERRSDPQGVAEHFMYTTDMDFVIGDKGSTGRLEVLVDEFSGQVRYVLYRSRRW